MNSGDVVDGKYELIVELGSGSYGVVWRVRHKYLKTLDGEPQEFAMKMMRDDLAGAPNFLATFVQEANFIHGLGAHPNLVAVREFGEDFRTRRFFMIMELLSGETLEARISRGPLDPDEAIRLLSGVAAGLGYAHDSDVIHRDVKPGNIFIGTDRMARVLDFGLARAMDNVAFTGGFATPAYMAPEQFDFDYGSIGVATDIYRLACVLYEMVSGCRPFPDAMNNPGACHAAHTKGPRPRPSYADSRLAWLDPVIAKGMAIRIADRYPSVGALAEAAKRAWHRSANGHEFAQNNEVPTASPPEQLSGESKFRAAVDVAPTALSLHGTVLLIAPGAKPPRAHKWPPRELKSVPLGNGDQAIDRRNCMLTVSSRRAGIGAFPGDAVAALGKVYVAWGNNSGVNVIDFSARRYRSDIRMVGQNPVGLAISDQYGKLYTANSGEGTVSVVDVASEKISTISVGRSPRGLATATWSPYVFVANQGDDTVSAIRIDTDEVTRTISVGSPVKRIFRKAEATLPSRLALSKNRRELFVLNRGDGSISVISIDTMEVVRTLRVGGEITDIAVAVDGSEVYLVRSLEGRVVIVDPWIGRVEDAIEVGRRPTRLELDPLGDRLYVSNYDDNSIVACHLRSRSVIASATVGIRPSSLAIVEDGSRIYVVNEGDFSLSMVDIGAKVVVRPRVGGKPRLRKR